MFLSLVWYVFLLLSLFTFTCSRVRKSLVVVVCPFFPNFLAGILSFYHSSVLPYICPIMRTSFGPSHPSSLRIGDSSVEGSNLGQIEGGFVRPAIVVDRVPLAGPTSPYGKGKDKVSEIRYPGGFAYLRIAMQNAEAVGPSRVEPSFEYNFEAAFENGLPFPPHPFIKSVLQYFNVCLAQLSPNFWGILVGLLVVFRDKGLGVPSIALLLDFFSVKESAEGFFNIAKRSNTKLIISDLLSSHKHWKERYFFVGGRNWEYNLVDREDTLGIPTAWIAPENLCELPFALIGFSLR